MSFFHDVVQLPEDPILRLPVAFAVDPRPYKVDLGVGSYKTADGRPLVLTSVQKAEQQILQAHLDKEYAPIEGDGEFLHYALQLLFGKSSAFLQSERFFATQTIGGTGGLRLAGEFLAKLMGRLIFISQPSWNGHKTIFERAGFRVKSYPYFNSMTGLLDFTAMCESINNMPAKSVILLHACCHNPTGIGPTFAQWQELSDLIKTHHLFPLFDLAYQGFGEGLDQDAQAIRYFAQEGHEMGIAYSFSKNFGLYGERVGFLTMACEESDLVPKIGSQMKYLVRGNYSNPPLHGARIVKTILKSPELTLEWQKELSQMGERIKEMRQALITILLAKGNGHHFIHMDQQKGLFSFTGLTPEQVHRLWKEKALYMPNNGRINVAGLNQQNLEYVADAFLSVVE
jgi:aspartate/tyrosine/aromatic aminotransferase